MEPFNWLDLWTRILPEWLTGLGTVGAAVVALWLARRDNSVRLRVTAGIRLFPIPGVAEVGPRYLWVNVTNVGRRHAKVTAIDWQIGVLWFKRYAVQAFEEWVNQGDSGLLPTTLNDGDSAMFRVLLESWLADHWGILRQSRFPGRWLRSRLVYAIVHTSTGESFRQRVEPSLADAIYRFELPAARPTASRE